MPVGDVKHGNDKKKGPRGEPAGQEVVNTLLFGIFHSRPAHHNLKPQAGM